MTPEQIEEAADKLKAGGVVIFPTDTVFGIGCKVTATDGIEKLYQIKGRDPSQPTHILVSNPQMASEYADLSNPKIERLIQAFWPGPLTLVVPAKDAKGLHSSLINSEGMVGLRMPDHQDLLEIIDQVGEGVLGPSANKKGESPPTHRSEIDKELLSLVDYVIGENSGGKLSSTIVTVSRYNWSVLRPGPITEEQINRVLS
jgi:L-threonylcarbamoyladenylate synthase